MGYVRTHPAYSRRVLVSLRVRSPSGRVKSAGEEQGHKLTTKARESVCGLWRVLGDAYEEVTCARAPRSGHVAGMLPGSECLWAPWMSPTFPEAGEAEGGPKPHFETGNIMGVNRALRGGVYGL